MTEDRTRPDDDPNVVEVLVRDPLNQVTRKERLYLLAISLISIAIVKTGLVPTKIATLGIELDPPDRKALLVLLALMTGYFLVGFLVYAASDFVTRREVIRLVKTRLANSRETENQQAQVSAQGDIDESRPTAERHADVGQALSNRNIQRHTARKSSIPNGSLFGILRQFWSEAVRAFRELVRAFAQVTETFVLVVGIPASRSPSTVREPSRKDELEQLGASTSSRIVASIRLFFEFALPIIVGVYAVNALLTASL